jgi:hypothetical protein
MIDTQARDVDFDFLRNVFRKAGDLHAVEYVLDHPSVLHSLRYTAGEDDGHFDRHLLVFLQTLEIKVHRAVRDRIELDVTQYALAGASVLQPEVDHVRLGGEHEGVEDRLRDLNVQRLFLPGIEHAGNHPGQPCELGAFSGQLADLGFQHEFRHGLPFLKVLLEITPCRRQRESLST